MPVPMAVISVPISWLPEHLVETRALDVEDFTLKRQYGLEIAAAALLGRSARRIALDNEQFGFCRVALLAIGEFSGQR